ncbi:hypothetical protein ABZ467_34080 [Streptomyces sp. NPDC005727]|uniref:hypothetical protein n=1 Tax=unclassified Streptomyces TaxID=2593676 RepID=UPI0033EA206B
MRKLRTAVAAAALIGGVGFMGAAPAAALPMGGGHGGGCKSHDFNVDIFGNVNVGGGVLGNLFNGEGSPGAQYTDVGSDCGGW